MTSQEPTHKKRERVHSLLGDPDLFPDTFAAWITRLVEASPNWRLQVTQLPEVEAINYVGATGNAAFEGTWTNYGAGYESAGYYKDPFGRVHLTGVIKSGTINTAAFILPGGYRPKARLIFVNQAGEDTGFRIDVAGDGSVIPVNGTNTYVSLDGISFRAYT